MKGARAAREGPRVPHAEAYERMNFLYQAAHQVMPTNPDLARQYVHQMVLITRRLVLRMYVLFSCQIYFIFLYFVELIKMV